MPHKEKENFKCLSVALDTLSVEMTLTSPVCLHKRRNEKVASLSKEHTAVAVNYCASSHGGKVQALDDDA